MADLVPFLIALFPLFIVPFVFGQMLPEGQAPWPSRWWFGFLLTGLVLIVGHALNVPGKILVILLTGLFMLNLFIISRRYKNHAAAQIHPGRERLDIHLMGVIAFLSVLLACVYTYVICFPIQPGDWDGLAIWYKKAKALFYWAPFTKTFEGDHYVNYPNLGPMLEMFVMKFIGEPSERHGRLVFPTLYVFWAMALCYLIPEKEKRWVVWAVPPIALAFFERRSFVNGYQDGFTTIAAGMAAIHFCRMLVRSNHTDIFLGFFFAGLTCQAKNEGVVLALLLSLALVLTLLLTYRPKQAFERSFGLRYSLLLFAVLFLLWPALLGIHNVNLENISGPAFSKTGILHFYKNLDRWPLMQPHFITYLKKYQGPIMASVLLTGTSIWLVPQVRRALLFLWLTLAGHILFVPIIFFATELDPALHLRLAFYRVIDQHFFAYAIILSLTAMALLQRLGRRVNA